MAKISSFHSLPIQSTLLIIAFLSYFVVYHVHNRLRSDMCAPHLQVFVFPKGDSVYTNDPQLKWAQGFVVNTETGRFVYVARTRKELVDKFGTCSWKEWSNERMMIVPGFVDAHLHIILGGQSILGAPLQQVPSKQEFIRVFEEYARFGYGVEEPWLTGGYWSEATWGGELPTRHWIDGVDKPAFLLRGDGHSALVNTKALQLANITRDTPDPVGGTIVRDKNGDATGLLRDRAIELVHGIVPPLNEEKALLVAMEHAIQNGITSCHHLGPLGKVGGAMAELDVYRKAEQEGKLKYRIYTVIELKNWHLLRDYIEKNGRGNQWLRVGMLKEFYDGSLGSQTALQYDPYVGTTNYTGLKMISSEQMYEYLVNAEKSGLQVSTHAIGERAVDEVLSLYEKVFKNFPKRDRRWRIEHAQQTRVSSRSKFAELDVLININPTHVLFDSATSDSLIGEKGSRNLYAFKSFFDAAKRKKKPLLSIGTDWFVASINPLLSIDAAVNRITESHPQGFYTEHAITIEDALKAYTVGSAYAGFAEHEVGHIKKGYLADFVLLSDHMFKVDKKYIKNIQVLETFVNGQNVYSRYDQEEQFPPHSMDRADDPNVNQSESPENYVVS